MLSRLFEQITRLSIRFRWVTIVATVIILVAGILAMSDLNLEMLPRIEFPQTVVVAQWPEADSVDQFLEEVTLPLEESLAAVSGVVNVESTTNSGFAFVIVRNDFGLNQDRVLAEIEEAVALTVLPSEMETPQVFNFSLADLPVVVASVSSSQLSLAELKAKVESELQPRLAEVEQISRVTISGGQELPKEGPALASDGDEVTAASPTPEPGRLPLVVIEGAKALGVEIESAQDVTPDVLMGLEGTAEQIMAVLSLVPPETLRYAPGETLALLPEEFVRSLDAALQAELDVLAADFGGIGQYSLEQVMAIQAGADPASLLVAVPDTVESPTATPEPVVAPAPEVEGEKVEATAVPEVEAVMLPESWIEAAAAASLELSTTADVSPEMMQMLVDSAPQLLAELRPEMWRALAPNSVAIALPAVTETLDAVLLAQLEAMRLAAAGVAPEAVELPEEWQTAAQGFGMTLETTADIPAEVLGQLATFAPTLLEQLTDEILLSLTPELIMALPAEVTEALDSGMEQTLTNVAIYDLQRQAMPMQAVAPSLPAVALPESWIAGAAALGLTISSTADVSPEMMSGIVSMAPEQLSELTPEMWRALPPDAATIALDQVADGLDLDAVLLAELQAIQRAFNSEKAEAVALPESWVTAAAGAGLSLETTADVPAEVMGQLASFAPQLLVDLSPDMLLAFGPEVLAGLPADYIAGLDAGLQQTIENVLNLWEQGKASEELAGATPGATTGDTARLPDLIIQGAKQAGIEMEVAQDVAPEFIRALTSFGPQGIQLLGLLTPEHLRLLPAESIALLPMEFIDSLADDLKVELDELAADFGGAGQLALEEAETADPARLPEILIQGAKSFGIELEFAQDITPEFIRPLASAGPQALELFAMLTPFQLRLLQPEVIGLLPAAFLDSLDAVLRADLDKLAAEYGGAGELAIAEAETAAAISAGSPALAGAWLEPGPDGEPSLFQTAGDILNNPFVDGAAALLNFFPESPNVSDPAAWMAALTPEVLAYLADNEEGFVENLSPLILEMMSEETLAFLLESYPQAFDADVTARLQGIVAGEIVAFVPEASITRTDGDPSLIVQLYKDGDANTVEVAHRLFDELEAYTAENPDVETNLVFEQATFIEDSITGVAREGALGAVFAVVVILVFLSGHVGGKYKLSWRATLVTGTSIPLSVFAAFLLMRWTPPTLGTWLQGLVETGDSAVWAFIARLFPTSVTLNIITLSAMTVAIGRVVDDSIVVLENSYRFIQQGHDRKSAVIEGTKEVAIAIFSATATTVAVFLPLGLIGGLIGSFFLPFGLTVTYALAASFVVSITVVPALTYMLIRREHIPEERETRMQRWYTPLLKWALAHRFYTMLIAILIFVASLFLLMQLPQSFIPEIGEPTINISVHLPGGTLMADTNDLVLELESTLQSLPGIERIQTEIGGGGGFESFFGGSGVSQNLANVTISTQTTEDMGLLTNEIRAEAEAIFGQDSVQVSAASQTGFGGFSMIVTGDSLDELRGLVPQVKQALASVDLDGDGLSDIVNVSSNLDSSASGPGSADTIIRIDGRPAVSFGGELETANTLGVTAEAKQAILDSGLPADIEVTEGFESEQQVDGFRSMVTGIGYSILIVYLIMALTFRSLIHPLTILFSLPFALVGAAVMLFATGSVLGISAMIGLMMLVGIVVTNGIVLMELVQQLRKRGSDAYEALVQGGRTRLRPIWMTALAAILALIPLGLSQEAGAIIASELALVVMGGLLVSTALTLVVIPVVYSLTDQLGKVLVRALRK